ncbi:MAG: hypothetical protein P1U77_02060, partial [Rubripirellula sp.]|nr:hypothetical protein [Rubripirellula sp.]
AAPFCLAPPLFAWRRPFLPGNELPRRAGATASIHVAIAQKQDLRAVTPGIAGITRPDHPPYHLLVRLVC